MMIGLVPIKKLTQKNGWFSLNQECDYCGNQNDDLFSTNQQTKSKEWFVYSQPSDHKNSDSYLMSTQQGHDHENNDGYLMYTQ